MYTYIYIYIYVYIFVYTYTYVCVFPNIRNIYVQNTHTYTFIYHDNGIFTEQNIANACFLLPIWSCVSAKFVLSFFFVSGTGAGNKQGRS